MTWDAIFTNAEITLSAQLTKYMTNGNWNVLANEFANCYINPSLTVNLEFRNYLNAINCSKHLMSIKKSYFRVTKFLPNIF